MINELNIEKLKDALGRSDKGDFYPCVYIIELTNMCNLNCVICPNKEIPNAIKGFIDVEIFYHIIKDIAPYCEFLMLYWMGEPLLHPHVNELLSIARSKIKGKIVLSSNMTYMNDEIAQSIVTNVDIVLCSIDRWKKKEYERIRVGANFEKTIDNVLLLLNQKGNTSCEIVVKAIDYGITNNEYHDFNKFWTSKGGRPLLAWLNDWAGTYKILKQLSSLFAPGIKGSRCACTDIWFKLAINWRGAVQICCFDWQYNYNIGSFCKDKDWLGETWNSERIVQLRNDHLNGNWNVTPICRSCSTWGTIIDFESYIDFQEDSYFIVF